MRKEFGKIKSIKIGFYDGRYGIHFELGGESWGVMDSWRGEEMFTRLRTQLGQSKKEDACKLPGTPIEVVFDGNMLASWRVLTEVL